MRVLLAVCALVCTAAAALDKQPHIVLMLADDLGWNDVQWHDERVSCPHMMKIMAEEGTELDQYYVQPQCTPSRTALMTGLYPYHQGMQHGVIYPTQQECTPLSVDLLPKALKDVGYDTHLVGKWHLGFCDKACTPPERGFDTFYGFYQGMNGQFDHKFGLPGMIGYDFRNGTELVTGIDGIHNTDLQLARTLEIIENHDTDAPMFLNIMWAAPHQPFEANKEWADKYAHIEDEEYRGYLGMISHMDEAIGDVRDAMIKKGLHDNAIYIFMADNGGEFPIGKSGKLRGAKGSLFDGGIRSASWIASPLIKTAGTKSEDLMHIVDWYPTLVSMAGGETEGLDGVDQTDMLIHGKESARTEFIVNIDSEEPFKQGHRAIRSGEWKLIDGYPGEVDGWGDKMQKTWRMCHWDLEEGWEAVVSPVVEKRATSYSVSAADILKEEKCIEDSMNEKRLYNLIEDPSETTNLADKHPEIVEELMAKLDEHEKTLVDVPYANTLSLAAGMPDRHDGNWVVGWCAGNPQANDPIMLHKLKKAEEAEAAAAKK